MPTTVFGTFSRPVLADQGRHLQPGLDRVLEQPVPVGQRHSLELELADRPERLVCYVAP